MPSLSQDAYVNVLLQKSVLETMLSNEKFQKVGTPHTLLKSIISIITSNSPKTHLVWNTSIKEKQFLYALYQTVFQNTPELNQFISSTLLQEKKRYGLKAARELESQVSSNASTAELNQCLAKIITSLGSSQAGGPSTHW